MITDDKRQTVLIVGDSLSLPRDEIRYCETWPYFLGELTRDGWHIVLQSKKGATSRYLRSRERLEVFHPALVIVQVGIVDCAPRLFKEKGFESYLVRKMPRTLRERYIGIIKKIRVRSPQRAYVSLEDFRKNIFGYAQRCSVLGIKVFFIEIALPGQNFIRNNPEISESVRLYNSVFYEQATCFPAFCKVISPFPDMNAEPYVLNDGYHINSAGAAEIAKQIIRGSTQAGPAVL